MYHLLPLNAKSPRTIAALPNTINHSSTKTTRGAEIPDRPVVTREMPPVAVAQKEELPATTQANPVISKDGITRSSKVRVDAIQPNKDKDGTMQSIFRDLIHRNAPMEQEPKNAIVDTPKLTAEASSICPASHMVATLHSPDAEEVKRYIYGLPSPAICLMGEPVHSIFSAAIAHVHPEWPRLAAFACPHVASFDIFCNQSPDDTIGNMVRIRARELRKVSSVAAAKTLLMRLCAEASLEKRIWTRAEWLKIPPGKPFLCVDLDAPDRKAMDTWHRAQSHAELYTVDASSPWVKELMPSAGFYVKQSKSKALAADIKFE